MLLLREVAPRYSRLAPDVANSFDNLHMFHGITYDILSYEGWTIEKKRAELDRVIDALRYHPGDERLARKFSTPVRTGTRGSTAQFKLKMAPGLQSGELAGSLHDAMMTLMPTMKMMPDAMEPGATPAMMVDLMLQGWRKNHGGMRQIAPMPMAAEPSLPPRPRSVAGASVLPLRSRPVPPSVPGPSLAFRVPHQQCPFHWRSIMAFQPSLRGRPWRCSCSLQPGQGPSIRRATPRS